jgi:hypothetical protein
MRKMIAMFVIAASVAACSESTEEVVVEGTSVDTNAVELDSTTLEGNFDDDSFGEEAASAE